MSDENSELKEFIELIFNQEELDEEFRDIVNENFFDLIWKRKGS